MPKMNLTNFNTGQLEEHTFTDKTGFDIQTTISGCTVIHLTDGDDLRVLEVREDRQKILYIREYQLNPNM